MRRTAQASSHKPEVERGSVPRRIRLEVWSLLTVLAVMGALIGATMLVRDRASEKDVLRQAQIALATVPGALISVTNAPGSLLAGQAASPSEYPLSRFLRGNLTAAATGVNRYWHTPLAIMLRTDVAQMTSRIAELMGLIAKRDVRGANVIQNRYVQRLTTRITTDVAAANSQLNRQTRAADQTAWQATLAIVGVTGALLLVLLIGVTSTRRRRLRTEIAQQVLRASEQRLQALVEHGSDMITVVTQDSTVLYQAGAVELMLGYAPEDLEGSKLTDWLDPGDGEALLELCSSEGTASGELRLRHRDGSRRTCEVHATSLLNDPAWSGIVLNIWDLSERKALEERLRHQAFHDALTGLPNRMLALDRARQMLARARRQSLHVAALYLDIDCFKEVNDRYGHAAGDELLRLVALRLSSVVREGDTAARLGGDEFVLLVEGTAADGGSELVAKRLLKILREPYNLEAETGHQLFMTATIGIALGGDDSADRLLSNADIALYEAKRAGRNRYMVFEPRMQAAARERITLETGLADALAGDELFLLYQPTFDLHSKRVIGVEALIRWKHPQQGILEASQFIPIAEATELIIPIGRWVLEEACRQAAAWHAKGHKLGVSVNISARQFDRDGLLDDVALALAHSGLDPACLTLEIAETTLMRNPDATARALVALKELGVRIAIDDFGTGYRSLAYLRQFRVDALKIDRSFIRGIASSPESAALIHTLVQVGKSLNLETLAEGIEEPAQLRSLQRELCDQGQGFLFARPLAADAVEAFLSAPAGTEPHALTMRRGRRKRPVMIASDTELDVSA
jgi:diguanylate cyclase (GGDEF)-like protein/PAS domain S-box-containing protein